MKKIRGWGSYLCFSLLLLTGLPALAQDTLPALTTPASPWRHYQLRNGLPLVVVHDTTVPLATLVLAIGGGQRSQLPGLQAAPALLQYLLLKPNQYYPDAHLFAERLRRLGLEFMPLLDAEELHYTLVVQQPQLEEAAGLLYRLALRPAFDSLEVRQAVQNLALASSQIQQDPRYYLQQDLLQALWGNARAPLHSPTVDFAAARRTTPWQLRAYHSSYFRPDNMLLIVGGDVQPEAVVTLADSLFGNWPSRVTPLPEPEPSHELAKDTAFITLHERALLPQLILAWPLPGTRQAPHVVVPALLWAQALNLRSGRLYQQLVQTGLATDLNVEYKPGYLTSELRISLQPVAHPAAVVECMDSLRHLPQRLQDTSYLPPAARSTALTLLEAEHIYAQERTTDFCAALAEWWGAGLLDVYPNLLDSLRHCSGDSLQHFAHYLASRPTALGLLTASSLLPGGHLERFVQEVNHPTLPGDTSTQALVVAPPEPQPDSLVAPEQDWTQYTVHFQLNKALLDVNGRKQLQALANYLRAHPAVKLFVDGHTDATGPARYNEILSYHRAQFVKSYLIKQWGIAARRLTVRGFGQRKPLAGTQPNNRALNRRVEFLPQ